MVPQLPAADRARLADLLHHILDFMDGDGPGPLRFDARAHVALPVIGLDEMLGVLFVDREYEAEDRPHHLRLLAAVCSQLGSYLTMGRLHPETVRQTKLLTDRGSN